MTFPYLHSLGQNCSLQDDNAWPNRVQFKPPEFEAKDDAPACKPDLGFLSLIIAAPNHAAEYRHYEGGNSDNFYVYYVSVNLCDRYHLSNMADSCWATCAWCYVQNRYIVSNHQNITFASCDSRNTNGFNWVDCLGYWKKTWANGEANICSNSFLVAFNPKYQVHYPLKTHASFCLQLMVHVAPVGSGA